MSGTQPPAISIEHLGKQYRLGSSEGAYRTLRESIVQGLKSPWRRLFPRQPSRPSPAPGPDTIWALKDVSFDIPQGEILGVIGRNGAGKTTLLKILSRITEPSEGRVRLRGRVGSLLEVGTGFHPELTGRENIFMNGAILGMSRREIQAKFDEIVAFAEIEPFLDTPLKRYSTGMGTRLAFAVAAHLETDILLVDEVLAVGDIAFQKKCLGKMGEVANLGRTLLFVSHNMGAIANLCRRAIWLDAGRMIADGAADEVVNRYQSQYLKVSTGWRRPASWTTEKPVMFQEVWVANRNPDHLGIFNANEPVPVTIRYSIKTALSECQIAVRVYNSDNLVIFNTSDTDALNKPARQRKPGSYLASFEIPAQFLRPGNYYLHVSAHAPRKMTYEVIEQVVIFEISPSGSLTYLDGRMGLVNPLFSWNTVRT